MEVNNVMEMINSGIHQTAVIESHVNLKTRPLFAENLQVFLIKMIIAAEIAQSVLMISSRTELFAELQMVFVMWRKHAMELRRNVQLTSILETAQSVEHQLVFATQLKDVLEIVHHVHPILFAKVKLVEKNLVSVMLLNNAMECL